MPLLYKLWIQSFSLQLTFSGLKDEKMSEREVSEGEVNEGEVNEGEVSEGGVMLDTFT